MQTSTIIEIDGVFVGAAIRPTGKGVSRFYAAHESVRSLHDDIAPDIHALVRRATWLFRHARAHGGGLVAQA